MNHSTLCLAALIAISTPAFADQQDDRKVFIGDLTRAGYFEKLDVTGSVARLWVTPAFEALTFDQKSKFVNVVYAYVITADSTKQIVVLVDSLSGNPIGRYAKEYGGLKMD